MTSTQAQKFKTVYWYYDEPDDTGKYYSPMVVPDNYLVQPPVTNTPIPDSIINDSTVTPKYNFGTGQWVGVALDEANGTNETIATLQTALVDMQTQVDLANSAILEMADMSLSSGDVEGE